MSLPTVVNAMSPPELAPGSTLPDAADEIHVNHLRWAKPDVKWTAWEDYNDDIDCVGRFERLGPYFVGLKLKDLRYFETKDLAKLASPYDRILMLVFLEKIMYDRK